MDRLRKSVGKKAWKDKSELEDPWGECQERILHKTSERIGCEVPAWSCCPFLQIAKVMVRLQSIICTFLIGHRLCHVGDGQRRGLVAGTLKVASTSLKELPGPERASSFVNPRKQNRDQWGDSLTVQCWLVGSTGQGLPSKNWLYLLGRWGSSGRRGHQVDSWSSDCSDPFHTLTLLHGSGCPGY